MKEITTEELSNLVVLQPSTTDKVDPLILVDIRPNSEFISEHIIGSINAPTTQLSKSTENLKDFFISFEKNFENKKEIPIFQWRNIGTVCIIGDLKITKKLMQVLYLEKKSKSVFFCNFTFKQFKKDYPYLVTSDSFRKHQFPTHILKNLYLGSKETAEDKFVLKSIGIDCIINCTRDIPCYFENENFLYHQIPMEDDPSQKLNLDSTIEFIEKNISTKKILIHCVAGRSRSVAVCIQYLKKFHQKNFVETHEFLRKKRPLISLNSGFVEQLKE